MGKFSGGNIKHLVVLLMRFHNLVTGNLENYTSDSSKMQLFDEVKALVPKGMVLRRTGGSSGETVIDEFFFQFLHCEGTFPVKAKAVKLVRTKDSFECFYISRMISKEGTFVQVKYSPPKIGGSFVLPINFFKKHPLFKNFALSKPLAAFVLDKLNRTLSIPAQPFAVRNELSNINKSLKKNGTTSCDEMIRVYNSFNRHTLVCHPVGYHQDIFTNDKPCLENKICFMTENLSEKYLGTGRGGAGPGKFVFAILDWEGYQRTRRSTYIAISGNADPPNVTEQLWQQFIAQNDTQGYDISDCIHPGNN